jgi:uncharacterized protein YbcI
LPDLVGVEGLASFIYPPGKRRAWVSPAAEWDINWLQPSGGPRPSGAPCGPFKRRSDAYLFQAGERRVETDRSTLEEVVPISDRPDDIQGPADPQRAEERRGPPSTEQVQGEISREILRIHEESYGKGAGKAHAFLGEGFVIVVLDDLELLPNEKVLVEHGKHETVIQVRTQYQHAIQASFRAAIERATGRTVVGFASTTSLDEPCFVAEVFKLE